MNEGAMVANQLHYDVEYRKCLSFKDMRKQKILV